MENNYISLASTMAQVFGGIAAIGIAFLALVFNRILEVRISARDQIAAELKNAAKCGYGTPTDGFLKSDGELRADIQQKCDTDSIDTCLVDRALTAMETHVKSLRDDKTVSNEQLGKNIKTADHIQRYHIDDLRRPYEKLKQANDRLSKFKSEAAWLLLIPLFFCSLFACFLGYPIYPNIVDSTKIASFIHVALAVGGLAIVYYQVLSRCSDLVTLSTDELLAPCPPTS